MMDVSGMVDRCVDAMGSMMGAGMVGSGILLVLLLVLLVLWVVGLVAVGALGVWAARKLSATRFGS
jgi:hypothetical protein